MKNKTYFIPLVAAIPVAILSAIMIAEALHYNGEAYRLPFVAYGGTFRFNGIHVFGISLYMFLMMVGLCVAIIVALFKRKQYGLSAFGAVLATILFFLQAYLGAKLLSGVEVVISEGDLQAWSMSGQSLFGVLYMSMPVVPLIALLFRKKSADFFDYFTPACPILLSFIRIGCFTSGCCGARELMIGGKIVLLPVQLFEVICDLAILSLCLWLDRPEQKSRTKDFRVFPVLLVTYCSTRFLLEFLRNNEVMSIGITISQLHCIVFFLVGIVWLRNIKGKEARAAMQEESKVSATH